MKERRRRRRERERERERVWRELEGACTEGGEGWVDYKNKMDDRQHFISYIDMPRTLGNVWTSRKYLKQ